MTANGFKCKIRLNIKNILYYMPRLSFEEYRSFDPEVIHVDRKWMCSFKERL